MTEHRKRAKGLVMAGPTGVPPSRVVANHPREDGWHNTDDLLMARPTANRKPISGLLSGLLFAVASVQQIGGLNDHPKSYMA